MAPAPLTHAHAVRIGGDGVGRILHVVPVAGTHAQVTVILSPAMGGGGVQQRVVEYSKVLYGAMLRGGERVRSGSGH